ncbi:unnamed protein product [Cladocopium goreaui]|uniref:ABC transporter G family member 22 n=1 Tax=Cladocopium goreaui TaxID=2562237 RepID=A0A9P1DST1_9DINO|nr:unnamed protein product [Cladocopium goreaui]
MLRADGLKLHSKGRLTPSGTEISVDSCDPDEPQLSEQYKKYLGNLPVLTILTPQQAAAEGLLGMAYGGAFLSGLCLRLSKLSGNPLAPGTLQLACYDGEGVSYQVHEDYVPKGDYDPENLPEHHRESYKRRITAILYLQDDWDKEFGGAFRAHAVRPKTAARQNLLSCNCNYQISAQFSTTISANSIQQQVRVR